MLVKEWLSASNGSGMDIWIKWLLILSEVLGSFRRHFCKVGSSKKYSK